MYDGVHCDEREAYALKLLEAGVRVTAIQYGTIHDFDVEMRLLMILHQEMRLDRLFKMLKVVLSV